jgi:hypothetical protein
LGCLINSVASSHPDEHLRKILTNWSSNSSPSGAYYTYDIADIYESKENNNYDGFEVEANTESGLNNDQFHYEKTHENRLFLGVGDFFYFNLIVLFILHPIWSMTTKSLVVFGCIISIHVSQYSTMYIRRLWQLIDVPVLPLPMITFSMYATILHAIMEYRNNDC